MTTRNVGAMQVGRGLQQMTTVQIADLVTRFGPTGTQEVDAIAPGTMVWDTTAAAIKVYTGTIFKTVTAV